MAAEVEAHVVTRQGSCVRLLTEKAATDQPGTSNLKVLAARMKDHFVLHGPQEGGSTDRKRNTDEKHDNMDNLGDIELEGVA